MAKKKEMTVVTNDVGEVLSYEQRLSQHTSKLLIMKKPNLDLPQQVETSIINYFRMCQEDVVKPTVSGLAMALGVSRETLLKYKNGETRIQNREAVVRAVQTIEVFDEALLKEGLMPALAGIFLFKNNYGYTDKTEVVKGTDDMSDEEIEKRYREKHEVVSEQ